MDHYIVSPMNDNTSYGREILQDR